MKLRTLSVPVYIPGKPPRLRTAAAMDGAVTGAMIRGWMAAGGTVPIAGPVGTEVTEIDEERGIVTVGAPTKETP